MSKGWPINLSGNNVGHAISTAIGSKLDPMVGMEAIANLPALIENALLVETHPDYKGERGLKQVHRFFAGFGLGQELYTVKITVKEYEAGFHAKLDEIYSAYDTSVEKEVPGRNRQGSPEESLALRAFQETSQIL